MKLEFAEVKYTDNLWQEAEELIDKHRAETVPREFYFALSKEQYKQMAEIGALRIFIALEKDTLKLVGYSLYAMFDAMNGSEPMAQHAGIYLDSKARLWMNGIRFIRYCDSMLKEAGIAWVTQVVTTKIDFSRVLERVGYEKKEILYAKRLKPIE